MIRVQNKVVNAGIPYGLTDLFSQSSVCASFLKHLTSDTWWSEVYLLTSTVSCNPHGDEVRGLTNIFNRVDSDGF
jgi:hypothetical protein